MHERLGKRLPMQSLAESSKALQMTILHCWTILWKALLKKILTCLMRRTLISKVCPKARQVKKSVRLERKVAKQQQSLLPLPHRLPRSWRINTSRKRFSRRWKKNGCEKKGCKRFLHCHLVLHQHVLCLPRRRKRNQRAVAMSQVCHS